MKLKKAQINYIYDKGKISYAKLENGNCIKLEMKSADIMEEWCLLYGCTLQGRKDFMQKFLKIKKKIPILLRDRDTLVFFPVFGGRHQDIWLNYAKIGKLKELDKGTVVIFNNGEELYFDLHVSTIRRQLKRCKTIVSYINENIV